MKPPMPCPHPHKQAFNNKNDAKREIKAIRYRARTRKKRPPKPIPYYCRCGKYHLSFAYPGRRFPGSVTQ